MCVPSPKVSQGILATSGFDSDTKAAHLAAKGEVNTSIGQLDFLLSTLRKSRGHASANGLSLTTGLSMVGIPFFLSWVEIRSEVRVVIRVGLLRSMFSDTLSCDLFSKIKLSKSPLYLAISKVSPRAYLDLQSLGDTAVVILDPMDSTPAG